MKDEELKKEAEAKETGQEEVMAENGQAACDGTEDACQQEDGTPEEASGDTVVPTA